MSIVRCFEWGLARSVNAMTSKDRFPRSLVATSSPRTLHRTNSFVSCKTYCAYHYRYLPSNSSALFVHDHTTSTRPFFAVSACRQCDDIVLLLAWRLKAPVCKMVWYSKPCSVRDRRRRDVEVHACGDMFQSPGTGWCQHDRWVGGRLQRVGTHACSIPSWHTQ